MVYVQDGTRRGSVKPDPTASLPTPPGTYIPHIKVTLHGQTVLVRRGDERKNVRMTMQSQQVDNFDGTAFGITPDNNFDAKIKGSPVDTLIMMYLHFYLVNTNAVGGNSITAMHPAAFWNRYEIMANGGSTDDTIYDTQIYQDFYDWLASDAERSSYSFFMGTERASLTTDSGLNPATWTAYDETANAIAPQTQREYFWPLICFLTTVSLWTNTKKVDPTIRVYGQTNPILSSNNALDLATAHLAFKQMEIYYHGLKFQSEIRRTVNDHILQGPLYLRTMTHDRQQQAIASVAQNTYLTDIQLTPLSGEYARFVVFVNRNDCTREGGIYGCNRTYAAATFSPLPLANVTFNDSSGTPVFFNDVHSNFLRMIEGGMTSNPGLRQTKNYYPFIFCTDPDTTLRSGQSTGGLALDGNYTFKFQLGTFTAGATTSVNFTCLAQRYSIFCMLPNGNFNIIRL